MRIVRLWLLVAIAVLGLASLATAQTINGTISGHVIDSQGLVLPGVTVTASSPNLQGVRTATTTGNGDYIFTLLPPGVYTVVFDLSGFEQVRKTVTLAPTQTVPLDATLGVAAVSETVNVVGRAADVLTQTAQVATDFKQDLIAMLPNNRGIAAPLLLAPAVHPTGPGAGYSISGAPSYQTQYMINGVTVNENLRGQALDLYIEDAIQETTISTAGISAEYGRFSGGSVNIVTKSGGNLFSGSFRDTLFNDGWRALTPFPGDTKTDKVVPTYEYTGGGPIARDHLWFFTAGRLQDQVTSLQTRITNIPYVRDNNVKRFEQKGTYSLNSNHRFQGSYSNVRNVIQNNSQFNVMDLSSLFTNKQPQTLSTFNYNGILSSNVFVEARVSSRHLGLEGSGSPFTDPIKGTLLIDNQRGTRYWTSTFCGACDAEKRDNQDVFVKGNYFLSNKGLGSHNMAFGYDLFNDKHFANNHQSGSDYRILGTTSIVRGTDVFPQFLPVSTAIRWTPILLGSQGSNFRTHSLFYNDGWRPNANITLNLGVRWDKNDGADQAGHLIAKDSRISPRLGVIWDPTGQGRWSLTASFARYVEAISSSIGDAGSNAGSPATYQWIYNGPAINADPNGPLVTSDVAIQQVFNWFNTNGGTSMPPSVAVLPGISTKINGSLDSPNVLEYAGGVNRQFGNKGAVRFDAVYRTYRDFYVERVDTTTGKVTNSLGQPFDLDLVENTNLVSRRYAGGSVQATYRFGAVADVGANYTLSRAWGNFDEENSTSGPITATVLKYPEYLQASWNYPEGDVSVDQRHRSHLWINYGVPKTNGLIVSVLQDLSSGVPYGAVGGIDPRPYVQNPGYITPPGAAGNTVNYYFMARDAFRTENIYRTDLAVNYAYRIKTGPQHVEFFGQAQVLNVFNQTPICGCGDTVFNNGGGVDLPNRIDTSVLTASTSPALQRFNPFTDRKSVV